MSAMLQTISIFSTGDSSASDKVASAPDPERGIERRPERGKPVQLTHSKARRHRTL